MHNFAQFRFNWQSIQRSLRIKWAWRPNCPLTPEKGWSLLVTLTLHWTNSVTNLAMNPAVAFICRLIAAFCLHGFLFVALLLNSITESFTIKKKKCPDNHFCKWTLPSNRPLFNMVTLAKCELLVREPAVWICQIVQFYYTFSQSSFHWKQ